MKTDNSTALIAVRDRGGGGARNLCKRKGKGQRADDARVARATAVCTHTLGGRGG